MRVTAKVWERDEDPAETRRLDRIRRNRAFWGKALGLALLACSAGCAFVGWIEASVALYGAAVFSCVVGFKG